MDSRKSTPPFDPEAAAKFLKAIRTSPMPDAARDAGLTMAIVDAWMKAGEQAAYATILPGADPLATDSYAGFFQEVTELIDGRSERP